nr:MAG TPA: hypothetical protein [Caudoviricetes sp.]
MKDRSKNIFNETLVDFCKFLKKRQATCLPLRWY